LGGGGGAAATAAAAAAARAAYLDDFDDDDDDDDDEDDDDDDDEDAAAGAGLAEPFFLFARAAASLLLRSSDGRSCRLPRCFLSLPAGHREGKGRGTEGGRGYTQQNIRCGGHGGMTMTRTTAAVTSGIVTRKVRAGQGRAEEERGRGGMGGRGLAFSEVRGDGDQIGA